MGVQPLSERSYHSILCDPVCGACVSILCNPAWGAWDKDRCSSADTQPNPSQGETYKPVASQPRDSSGDEMLSIQMAKERWAILSVGKDMGHQALTQRWWAADWSSPSGNCRSPSPEV